MSRFYYHLCPTAVYLTLSLGNRVWIDDGRGGGVADNGLLDGSEAGVGGVVLALLDGNKQPLLDVNGQVVTTTTDLAGYYLFPDLLPGEYAVQILPINFQNGGALAGYRSSSSTEEDPNQDGDTNDNGIDSATPAIDGICSNVVTLAYATEPDQEPDPGQLPDRSLDTNSNLTVDFGFVAQSPTTLVELLEPLRSHRLFSPWEMGRWGDGEMGRWGDGEMGRWGDGEMGRWGDGEMGRWGDGEMGR